MKSKVITRVATIEGDEDCWQSADNENAVTVQPRLGDQMWTSVWLRTTTLIAFAILYTLLAAVVLILYLIALKKHGLSTQKESHRFLWTYGPTARM